jgi:hypothetical protein
MHESDVVGIKDTLECRKNYPIVLSQIREGMEQIHYCSPAGGCLTVFVPFRLTGLYFISVSSRLFLPRYGLDASVERKVTRTLHRVNDDGADGTRQKRRKLHFWMRIWNGILKG